ncbi:hypothetical protein DL93DRAFT_2088040 [Clavulina sp. PMI_390]|nr:hypothetical protein DL93DRAFT_2088040 [Clavulina sp. PMI_390]
MFLEHEKTGLEAELRNTLSNITTIADQYSAMNLTCNFVSGLNRSISLPQVQTKVYAQRDPDTAEGIQKMIEVLMTKKKFLEEAASRKTTQNA